MSQQFLDHPRNCLFRHMTFFDGIHYLAISHRKGLRTRWGISRPTWATLAFRSPAVAALGSHHIFPPSRSPAIKHGTSAVARGTSAWRKFLSNLRRVKAALQLGRADGSAICDWVGDSGVFCSGLLVLITVDTDNNNNGQCYREMW